MERFDDLIKRVSEKLKGLIYKIHYASSFIDQDDLYQEAVCHLWQRFERQELSDKNESYILKSCYFHLKNFQRTQTEKFSILRPTEEGEENDECIEPLGLVADKKDNLNYLNARVLVSDIQNNGLTKREKEVFSLMLAGLNVREIAGRIGVSHVRVVKIKARIREKYENKFRELPK